MPSAEEELKIEKFAELVKINARKMVAIPRLVRKRARPMHLFESFCELFTLTNDSELVVGAARTGLLGSVVESLPMPGAGSLLASMMTASAHILTWVTVDRLAGGIGGAATRIAMDAADKLESDGSESDGSESDGAMNCIICGFGGP